MTENPIPNSKLKDGRLVLWRADTLEGQLKGTDNDDIEWASTKLVSDDPSIECSAPAHTAFPPPPYRIWRLGDWSVCGRCVVDEEV